MRPVTLGGGSGGGRVQRIGWRWWVWRVIRRWVRWLGRVFGVWARSAGARAESGPPPTPVDTVVKVVTSVTKQVPAPAGPVVTQAVQEAGSAADNLLPPSGQPAPVEPGAPAGGLAVP